MSIKSGADQLPLSVLNRSAARVLDQHLHRRLSKNAVMGPPNTGHIDALIGHFERPPTRRRRRTRVPRYS